MLLPTLNCIQLNSAIALPFPQHFKSTYDAPDETTLLQQNEYLLVFIHFHVNLWENGKAVAHIFFKSSICFINALMQAKSQLRR
jgi:hypothetical protein